MFQKGQNPSKTPSKSNYQLIFDNALAAYKKKTGKDIISDPLLRRLESCDSPDTVLAVLREQVPGFDQIGGSNEANDTPTKWLKPTVNVLYIFSSTIGSAASLVSLRKGHRSLIQILRTQIYILGLSTRGGDLHGHCNTSLGGWAVSYSVFLCTVLTPRSLRLSRASRPARARSWTYLNALKTSSEDLRPTSNCLRPRK
jgi:hypothetical protein